MVYKSDAEKHRLLQAQRLIDAFTKAKGYAPTTIAELNEWAVTVPDASLKAIADGVDA